MGSSRKCGLPADAIQEILLRLPVKILSQFKCVCKEWYTLIGSPSFIDQHFHHENNQECLLVRHWRPNEDQYAYALFVDEMCSRFEEPNHLQMPDTVDDLMGPLNGVFYVVTESERMALLNPALRQFKPLPSQAHFVQPHLSLCDIFLGFGMDPLSGHYKVVSIRFLWEEESVDPIRPPLVTVYNSGSDSWKQVEEVDLLESMDFAVKSLCNTYLNGVYYWVMYDEICEVFILAFDMSNDKFQEINIPEWIMYVDPDMELALYGDSLVLLLYEVYDNLNKSVDVWVLNVEGYWTKSLSLGPFQDMRMPRGFWNNKLLLEMKTTTKLTLYDVSTQKLTTVEARKRQGRHFRHWVFKESLVSLKREGNNCVLWDTASDFVIDFFE